MEVFRMRKGSEMKRGGPLKRYTPLRKIRLASGKKKRPPNLKKILWKLVSEYVRRKSADHAGMVACVTCGKSAHWKQMDCGHYIPKSLGLSIYFEERNLGVQCSACNRFRHGNLAQYALYLLKTYGASILDELDALRRTTRKISTSEYLELIERYKSKLKALENREAA
jgi:hypothetical protein